MRGINEEEAYKLFNTLVSYVLSSRSKILQREVEKKLLPK